MMENKEILGIIIVVILLITLIGAIYLAVFGYTNEENEKDIVTKTFKLDKSQVQGIKTVNLNFSSKSGGAEVYFPKNMDSIYEITFKTNNDSKIPTLTYNRQGDVLNINTNMESGSAKIALDSAYTYNGNIEFDLGGLNIALGNGTQIDQLNTHIKYFGGGYLLLDEADFNQVNMKVNTGGFMIMGTPKMNKSGNITTNAQIGGITIALKQFNTTGVSIRGVIDSGGINFEPGYQVIKNTNTSVELQSPQFNQTPVKLILNNSVGLGGININNFLNFFNIPLST
ncbi:hypothetical protein [Methanobacterium alcaliphilum]|uniref:hypothetical protein n=1 Tax=Methanobacterium alcaliphilum TaxID=392018 RepID=UPI00200A39E1|nr:hypothetical protein [Methanobacterium alcaliphilum]MCK9151589.1 hypothetical protein [Methanobacterium alcaliphilum]